MKKILLFAIIFNSVILYGQNQSPAKTDWNKIDTENFMIVFPQEIAKSAQRLANTLELVHKYDNKTLDGNPKKIQIFLHNKTTVSNAFAAIAPRKMFFYMTPPQGMGLTSGADWLEMLSIHEYRHAIQYSKNKRYFTKLGTMFLGDYGLAYLRWSIPMWFYEGDAICAETALSDFGRGRSPLFSMPVRTILLSDQKFSYNNAKFNMYNKFYPNHYYLGYYMTSYAREKYGKDIWNNTLRMTSMISFWPYAFSLSLRKHAKLNTRKLYNESMSSLKTMWQNQITDEKYTEVKIINNKKKKTWTNYYNPHYLENESIITIKSGLGTSPTLYIINPDGTEKKIKQINSSYISAKKDKLCWAQKTPHIRWGLENYSDIMVYDLQTKARRKLSSKAKLFAPSLSNDATKIVAVEFNSLLESSLVIMNTETGEIIEKISSPDNEYIRTPSWSEDGSEIVFLSSKSKGAALKIYNINTKSFKILKASSNEIISRPVFYNNYVIYSSSHSGVENIYAIDTKSLQKFRIVSRKFGVSNPKISANKKKLVFQDYNAKGYDIAEIELNSDKWERIENVNVLNTGFYKHLVEQEQGQNIMKEIPSKKYGISKYNKIANGINIHSWGIYPFLPNIEATIISRNNLNTLSITPSYIYNINEETNAGILSIEFAKYFPVFNLGLTYMERNQTYTLSDKSKLEDSWKENSFNFGIKLPFNLSRDVFATNFSIETKISYTDLYDKETPYRFLDEINEGSFKPLSYTLNFSRIKASSTKDIGPKCAQLVNISYKHLPFDDDYKGFLFSARASLYLPSIFKHHNIILGAAYEKQMDYIPKSQENYYFSSRMLFPRGYSAVSSDELSKVSVDYQFPILYPNFGIGSLIYFKRLKGSFFYDYALSSFAGTTNEYQSAGAQVILEFNILRLRRTLQFGIRYTKLISTEKEKLNYIFIGLPF